MRLHKLQTKFPILSEIVIHDQPVNKLKPIAKLIIRKINDPIYPIVSLSNSFAREPSIPPCSDGRLTSKLIICPASNAEEEIIKGKSPDVAYKYKGEVSGGSSLDETNPPKYIFQITDGLLNSDGASLHKVSKVVEINEYQVTKLTAQQMRKQFRKKEMWRLQGYVNWRMEKQIKNKTNDIKWTKGQIKNLKRYWGIEVK